MPLPGIKRGCPVIGMIHLRALPGAPDHAGDARAIGEAALSDLGALTEGGVDAVLVENFFDAPFFPARVPPITVAHMSVLVRQVCAATDLPVGVNVLRNDGLAALAVAHAAGADFIRVNVLTGARLTDQGIVRGIAHRLARRRSALDAGRIRIFADVDVKHSAPLAPYDRDQEVEDAVVRGGADAVIVSGAGTGKPAGGGELERVRTAAAGAPVLVGSGVTPDNATALAAEADGLIVGTWLKRDGHIGNGVDADRVRHLVATVRRTEAVG